MSKAIAVVQARIGSSRLPGKVLMDVGGKPVLEFMLSRLGPASVDELVVATTDDPKDDEIADLVAGLGVEVVRGSERDVLARYALAVERHPSEYVVRLTADCPLMDPAIVDAAISLAARDKADYVSNTLIRTYPDGLDVEVIRSSALLEAAREARAPEEREHVTPYIYRRPDRFALGVLRQPEDLSYQRWTVDYPEDLTRVKDIVAHFGGRHDFGWRDALSVLGPQAAARSGVYLRTANEHDLSYFSSLQEDTTAMRLSDAALPDVADGTGAALLSDCRHRAWVAELDGARVGAVWMDIHAGVARSWIVVERSPRSAELATALIRSIQRINQTDYQIQELRAQVRASRDSALRILEDNGFQRIGEDGDLVALSWS